MGGNAFKDRSCRLHAEEFHEFSARVMSDLGVYFSNYQLKDIKAYAEKESFGDLDILIAPSFHVQLDGVSAIPAYDHDAMKRILHAVDMIRNGPVRSYLVPVTKDDSRLFQVDVIWSDSESFNFAYNYFCNNDLGNLIGRIAHAMGCKFGHDGLWYPMLEGDYKFDEILITRKFEAALYVLGFDSSIYTTQFNNLDEIFEFVASSDFFNPSYYPLEHRSHAARIRDRKRPTYNAFLKWININVDPDRRFIEKSKTDWRVLQLFLNFPSFRRDYMACIGRLERSKEVKRKFNGDLVREWTGLDGKELGAFMKFVRKSFASNDELSDWVISSIEKEIEFEIKLAYIDWMTNHEI